MVAALKVIQPTPVPPEAQNCSQCWNFHVCWDRKASARIIQTNLLVCRLKRGIDVNRTTRMLLDMLRPKLLRTVQSIRYMAAGAEVDGDTVLADVESTVVEMLLRHWILGELAFPLHYLFGIQSGVMNRWARAYAARLRRTAGRETVEIQEGDLVDDGAGYDDRAAKARVLIHDGVTLSTLEFRVLHFMIEHAEPGKRPNTASLTFLERTTGLSRAALNDIFATAARRIAQLVEADLDDEEDE